MQRALTPGVTKMTRTHLFSFKSNRSVDGRSGQRYQIGNVLLLIYFISGPLTSSDRGSLSASPSAGRKGRKGLGNPENIYLVLDRPLKIFKGSRWKNVDQMDPGALFPHLSV